MIPKGNNTILDWSGPEKETTATESSTTEEPIQMLVNRKREKRWIVSKEEIRVSQDGKVDERVGTLNVGTITGKGREVAEMMERIIYTMHTGDKVERKQSKRAWQWVQAIL